jgi:hypothetical protein
LDQRRGGTAFRSFPPLADRSGVRLVPDRLAIDGIELERMRRGKVGPILLDHDMVDAVRRDFRVISQREAGESEDGSERHDLGYGLP